MPIPEFNEIHAGLETAYLEIVPQVERFGVNLPAHLAGQRTHLDPDFRYLTYGDSGRKATQLRKAVSAGDYLVFYSGLKDVSSSRGLVYAIIGVFEVERVIAASALPREQRYCNAHGRRVLPRGTNDVIVFGRRQTSGRLAKCIPIGAYRSGAYRVDPSILRAWGGISVSDGYLQRSAVIPRMLNPDRFLSWLEAQHRSLLHTNN